MPYIEVNGDRFEIVESVPLGYQIWNIGSNMPAGYLPLCRVKQIQPFNGCTEIETDTLKAVKAEKAQNILAVACCGATTLQKMWEYVQENISAKPGTYARSMAEKIKKILPDVEEIWKY